MALILNLMASWWMAGLIWVVQLVHYPAFRFIAEKEFSEFHTLHTRKITSITGIPMLVELTTTLWLTWQNQLSLLWLLMVLMVLGLWLSTVLLQIPIHQRLSEGKDSALIDNLIKTNWIRTILWTIKALILTWIGAQNSF